MTLRDEVETVVRGWHRHEVQRGGRAVVDFDCYPVETAVEPLSRLAALSRFEELLQTASQEGDPRLAQVVAAHRGYLRCLLGERPPLETYVRETQGVEAGGWSEEYVERVGARAHEHLFDLGVGWDGRTDQVLNELEGHLDPDDAEEAIRGAATELEPLVREVSGSTAPYQLTVQATSMDAYWAYWLDGSGSEVRLRLNLRRARFTTVQARQFALHEVLGHGLQSASFADRCRTEDVPWVRLLSVHGPHQVLLEGLAQALPLFVTPKDTALVARVRLAHFTQLVSAQLHLAINAGTPVAECAARAKAQVPFWTDEHIGDLLTDRGVDPQLRSYLWAYPAGIDWFVRLFDQGGGELHRVVLREAFRQPLTPNDLEALWPPGPRIKKA